MTQRFKHFCLQALTGNRVLVLNGEQCILSAVAEGEIVEQQMLAPSEMYVIEELLKTYSLREIRRQRVCIQQVDRSGEETLLVGRAVCIQQRDSDLADLTHMGSASIDRVIPGLARVKLFVRVDRTIW